MFVVEGDVAFGIEMAKRNGCRWGYTRYKG